MRTIQIYSVLMRWYKHILTVIYTTTNIYVRHCFLSYNFFFRLHTGQDSHRFRNQSQYSQLYILNISFIKYIFVYVWADKFIKARPIYRTVCQQAMAFLGLWVMSVQWSLSGPDWRGPMIQHPISGLVPIKSFPWSMMHTWKMFKICEMCWYNKNESFLNGCRC